MQPDKRADAGQTRLYGDLLSKTLGLPEDAEALMEVDISKATQQ